MIYSLPEFRAEAGSLCDDIPDRRLFGILQQAQATCDTHCKTHFGFYLWGGDDPLMQGQTSNNEAPISSIGLPTDPQAERFFLDLSDVGSQNVLVYNLKFKPVRRVFSIHIVTMFMNRLEEGVRLDENNITVTRSTGIVQGVSLMLTLEGGLPLIFTSVQPYVAVIYSSGFDDGPVIALDEDGSPTLDQNGATVPILVNGQLQPTARDGLISPYPEWLKRAYFEVAMSAVDDWHWRQMGAGGMESLHTGPYSYSRPRQRGTKDESKIPHIAREILDGAFQNITIGGSS